MLELISPAGSPEAVVAAVQNGADAIFLARGSFNARRRTQGFSPEEFKNAMRYCRIRGCKVYVAMNVLVSDAEIPSAVRDAREAAEAGADALIVRDIGLARVLHEVLPDMPLFASGNMGVHDLAGVRAAAELGFSRVAVSRELPRDQIANICAGSPIGVYVFVQSEMCVCHPGLCYLSSFAGGHSANRGLCDGQCKKGFSLGGRRDDNPLSMKDSCLIGHLDGIASMGAAGIIVDGRDRGAEYTALATSMYRSALDNGKLPSEQDSSLFRAAFSSAGFSDGYFTGEKGEGMFGRHKPGTSRDISKALAQVRRSYTGMEVRRVPVEFYAMINEGEPSKFIARDDSGNQAAVLGPVPAAAEGNALLLSDVDEAMYKTAGTPFSCSKVRARIAPNVSLSSDELAAVRGRLLDELSEKRRAEKSYTVKDTPPLPEAQKNDGRMKMIFHVLSASQLSPELASMKPDYLYMPLEELASSKKQVSAFMRYGITPVAVLPQVIRDSDLDGVRALLEKCRDFGVREAMIGNLGHITLVRAAGMQPRGDYGLNVFNSYTAELLSRAGMLSCTASYELHIGQLRALQSPLNTEIIVYGRLPVMTTECCVIKNSAGKCACQSAGQLSDGRGAVYPVLREYGCRNVILGAHKLFLADRRADYEALGLWGARLMFTTESSRECVEVARSYLGISDYKPNGLTRGRMYKGVE